MAQKTAHSLSKDDHEVMNFLKKVKVEQESINSIVKKKYPEINIKEHELNKFLTIFNTLIESNLEDLQNENIDSEDGFTNIIKIVIVTLLELISKNLETINLPKKIEKALEKLKQFLSKHGKNKASTKIAVTKEQTAIMTNNEQNSTFTTNNSR